MKKVKMIRLTHWVSPNEGIDTQWGVLGAEAWLIKEMERITKSPERVAEIRSKGTKFALFVDEVASTYTQRLEDLKEQSEQPVRRV